MNNAQKLANRTYQNKFQRERKNKMGGPGILALCTKCGKSLPATLEFFYYKGASADGCSGWCRSCYREHARIAKLEKVSTEEGRNKYRLAQSRYSKSEKGIKYKRMTSVVHNPRKRARRVGAPVDWFLSDWQKCVDWFGGKCAYCGKPKKLEVDHFIPLGLSNEVGTVPHNMVPSCEHCNSSKGHKHPSAWCSKEALDRIAAFFDHVKQLERS
jgi:5-methylcytosine-specific restriction endonuclease McrA